MEDPIYEILGCVKGVNIKEQIVNIVSLKSKKSFTFKSPGFFPVRSGDIIHGYFTFEDEEEAEFLNEPTILIGTKESDIMSMIKVCLRRKPYLAKEIYTDALESTKENYMKFTSVDIIKKKQPSDSELVCEYLSEFCEAALKGDPELKDILLQSFTGLEYDEALTFVSQWTKSITTRRLYCMGFTKRDINETLTRYGISMSEMYHIMFRNPYYFVTIPYDKCLKIRKLYDLEVDRSIKRARKLLDIDEEAKTSSSSIITWKTRYENVDNIEEVYKTIETHYDYIVTDKYIIHGSDYKNQSIIAKFLKEKIEENKSHDSFKVDDKSTLSEEQQKAVYVAYKNNVSIITGSGGSGKTTSIENLCMRILDQYKKYLLLTFTGKANSRLKEKMEIKQYTMTIHKALKENFKNIDYIIIDEISMVYNQLLAKLILAIIKCGNTKVKFCFVGDPKQLQPISCGDLFNQLLLWGKIPIVKLTKDFRRNNQENLLYYNTFECAQNEEPEIKWGDNFEFISGNTNRVLKLIQDKKWSQNRFKVIAPFNKDVNSINEKYSSSFYENGRWAKGMLVMMTENIYEAPCIDRVSFVPVMNGEEGVVVRVRKIGRETYMSVKFPSGIIVFSTERDNDMYLPINKLVKSWCITTHKSQGSEWDNVIIYLSKKSNFVNNPLLYTSITRAKVSVFVIADDKSFFEEGILLKEYKRHDNLLELLKK